MLKNIRNLAISRQFLISLIFIVLMFTAIGVNVENSYAVDLNESVEDLSVELDVEDKLENSQNEEILENSLNEEELKNPLDEEILGATYSLDGGNFRDIQNLVNSASAGDTIKLSGTFTAQSSKDTINITKKLTIMANSEATLNAKNLCRIFTIKTKAAGTTISDLTFINGYSENDGGAIGVFGKKVTIDNCVFEKNYAEMSSGALHTSYFPKVAEDIVVKNCKFRNNRAGNAAGALGVFGYNFNITNCIFESNTVMNERSNCYGGAVQVGMDTNISYGIVKNCKFVNNKAISKQGVSHGGAGCVRNGTHYINCIFINNSADHGGALTFHASGSLNDCEFYNNTANDYGGAVSISLELNTMNLNISDCVFNGNSAPLGGAVRLSGMNIKIVDSNFTDNYASQFGGAINIAAVNVNVSHSNFNENVANVNGGAIYINGKNTVVDQSSFIGNDAIPDVNKLNDGLGGAIYMNSTQAYIQNNVFKFNTARNGSAVYYDKSGSRFRLTNNVMYQNQAWVYLLPVFAQDIYYGEVERIRSIIYGGNNIAKYNNLAVSNAIYNAASNSNIAIDGETPVLGATMSGQLYQDDREYNMNVLITVTHEDGSVVYNRTLVSSYLGEVSDVLANLKPGLYQVKSTHYEDTYYKGITNTTYFRVIPKVDNMILKSANNDEFNYDDIIVWTLNITNNGPNNATRVVVRDVLPEGVEYLRDTSGGKYDPATGVLTIGNLAVGQSVIIDILTVVKTTGEITNNANVSGEEYDIDLTNNQDNDTVFVNPAIDLEVTKSVNNSNPNFNDLVDWTVVVKNNGPDVAHDVEVYDVLPSSLIYVSSTGDYDVNNNCWSVGTLNVGGQVILHIVSRVNATGVIENGASASGREYDINASNNFDDERIYIGPACDLAIVKSVNASAVNYGDLVKWTLTVRNNGPDVATGVYVDDFLPDGFVYVDSVLDKGRYSNGRINVGTLAVGEQVRLNIICRVLATGTFVNVANVTGNEYDYDLTNNKDKESVLVYSASDLEVIKLVNNSNPNFNDLVDWTVIVRNNGPNIAHDVKVYEMLPDSLIYVNSTGNYNVTGNFWDVGILKAGKQFTFHIITKVNATGSITNNVNVTGRNYDYNMSNNFDNESIAVNSSCDLAIVKSVNASAVNYGDLVKWTLTVRNNGPDVATGVYVVDALPDGFVYVDSVLDKGRYSNGRINVGNLAVGEQVRLNIICRVLATGTFVNVANVTGREYDYDLTNNRDDEPVAVAPASDLEVIKLVNNSNPNFNDLVDWTVIVKNNGPDVARGIKVYDVLPHSLIYVNSTGNYNVGGNYWDVGTLNIGRQVTLHIVTRVNATGPITNNVNVTGRNYDYNMSNNFDNESIAVNSSCDLAIVKSVNASAVNYGDLVKWTLTVRNNGPDVATGVYVVDALPDGFVYVDSVLDKGSYSNGRINVGTLAVGEQVRLNIICRVLATGTFVNVANVTGREYDYDLTNNRDDEPVAVAPASDLEVIKLVNNSNPNFNDLVGWTVIVRNNGPNIAHDVKVYEMLPDSLIYVNSTGNYNVTGNFWDVGILKAGKQFTFHIITKVNATGSITNNVNVDSRTFDFNPSNNFDNESIAVNSSCDLAIVKSVNASAVNYGDLVKWTLTVRNNGPDAATGVYVVDALPDGFVYVDSVLDKGSYSNGRINVGNLAVGEQVRLNIICRVLTTGTFVNVANVTGNEYDHDLTNNEDNESVLVYPASDLEVIKLVNNSNPNFNDLVDWTVIVRNNGPNVAHDIKVYEVLPSSLIYVNSTGNYNVTGNYWDVGTLKVGKQFTFHIITKVNATGEIENNVSVEGREYDFNPSNNFDDERIDVNSSCDLAIVKSVNGSAVNYGDLVKWTLTVRNNGPDVATGVYVDDALPDGFVYVDSVLDKGSYSNGRINVGTLAVGEQITLNIICRVLVTGTFVNVANVTGNEYDHDLTNNKDNESILVYPASDLEVIKLVNNSNPNYHDLVDWTVIVKNNGPDVAHDIKVYEVLPSSLIYVNSTGDYNVTGNYWDVGTLKVGKKFTFHIITKVNATGSIINNVNVKGREYDFNTSNNFDDKKIHVNPSSDLAVVKSVNVSAVNYGDLVKWTLTVRNNGPDVATGVYVDDALPDGFVYVDSVLDKGSYSNGRIDVGNLAVGEQVRLNIICRVLVTGTFVNVVNVTGNEYDHDLTNNKDNESVLVYPASDLEVIKLVNNSNPNFNDLVDWTVIVKNNGPDVAHDIKVYEVLPDSLIYVNSTGNYNVTGNYWDVGTLKVGKKFTFHIITKVNATGSIINNVNVKGREYDFNTSNNFDDKKIHVNPSSDLTIVKSVNVSAVNYGDLVKWTLTVRNNGPDAATGVYVIDTLPDGFVYVDSVLDKGSYSNGRINVGTLAVGEQVRLNIICRVLATGTFVNVANVTGNEYDYDLTNNKDNESILVYPASDLEVIKLVDNSTLNYAESITWTIIVKNNGPDKATEVKVYDSIPKTLIWQNDDGLGKYDHQTGIWDIGELAKGNSVRLNIVCKVNSTGVITNIANVTASEYDYNLTNNEDNESIVVPPAADVLVEKLVNNSNPNYTELVKWTLIISNNGPDKATDVYVTENLPDGLILINYTASKGIYDNGVWAMCCLNKSEVQTLEIVCRVNKTGEITNIVSIQAKEYDPNPSNNEDNESIRVPPSADLELIKDVDNESPDYGDTIVWTVIIKNNGPDNATGVVVDDVLSSDLIFVSYSASNGVYSGNKWDVGTLNVGCIEYLNITCITNALGEIVNYAEVKSNEYDWDENNNYDASFVHVSPVVDLAIEKVVNNPNPNYGDLVKWTLIVRNNGPNNATRVVVHDALPKGLTFVESSSKNYQNGIWNVGYLDAGESEQLEIICKVSSTGYFINEASVSGRETDLDWSNNYDSESIDVPPASDLSITKVAKKYNYVVGDLVQYAIKIINKGPDAAKNVKVRDMMEDALTLKSFSASAGDFDKETETWEIDSLDVGESASLLINAISNKEGTAENHVSASSDSYDPDLTNNEDSALVNISKNETPDVQKTPDANEEIVDNYCPEEIANEILEKNVSGNSIFVLLFSLIFSVIFLSGNISKRD